MKYYDVIYQLTEEIAKEMAGVLGPLRIENVLGRAEVKEVFPAGKRDKAAGLLVLEGVIRKGLYARLTRDDVIVSATTDRLAAALQGRRRRSPRRPRMRRGPGRHQRHQAGRPARGVRGRGARTGAVSDVPSRLREGLGVGQRDRRCHRSGDFHPRPLPQCKGEW